MSEPASGVTPSQAETEADMQHAGEPEERRIMDDKTILCASDCDFRDGGLCTCGACGPECPVCNGAGGAMSGYYQPEWYDCRCCEGAGCATLELVAEFQSRQKIEEAACNTWLDEQAAQSGMKN